MSVDLKYDVLCECLFMVYLLESGSNGLNFVFVSGTACCNPT